jgi:hypothetical protein
MGVGDEATRTKLTTLKKIPTKLVLPNWINIAPPKNTHTKAHYSQQHQKFHPPPIPN